MAEYGLARSLDETLDLGLGAMMRCLVMAPVVLAACASDPPNSDAERLLADLPFCEVVGDRVHCKRDCTIEVPGQENASFDEMFACAWSCNMPADATMADIKELEIW